MQFGGQEMVYRLQSNAQQVRVGNEGVSLTVDANLNLTGTPDKPVVLGRVLVNEGEVNFFGTKYTINRGGNFSILAVRDENGIFGIDFQYRRRFR